jgi:hypothetical protein
MEGIHLFACGVVGLPGVAFGLKYSFLVGFVGEGFGLLLDKIYDAGVSSKWGVVRSYDGLDNLVHGLLTLRVNPCYDFFLKFMDLDVENGGACCVDQLVGVFELGFLVVVGDCKMVNLEAVKALVPFGQVKGSGVVKISVEGGNYSRQAV